MGVDAIVIVGLCVLAVRLWRLWGRRTSLPQTELPTELRNAHLVYSERLFRSSGSTRITARVDRAYRNAAGALVLVELKTRKRHRIYPSDVIELSAQRVALTAQKGEVVADHAYVLTVRVDDHSGKYHRVSLMTVTDVLALATRREELLAGNVMPRPGCFSAECRCSEQISLIG